MIIFTIHKQWKKREISKEIYQENRERENRNMDGDKWQVEAIYPLDYSIFLELMEYI